MELDFIQQLVLAVVPIFAGIIVTWLVGILNKHVGVQLSKKDSEVLQSALNSGINMALNKWVIRNPNKTVADVINSPVAVEEVIQEAKGYVETSVPDALRRLNPAAGFIFDLLVAKLPLKF